MKAEQKELVSIVVVSLRGGEMLKKCLDSISRQDYPSIEAVIVDNGSGLDLRNTIGWKTDCCAWITEKTNLGFAGGCNRGIAEATGSMIALVNDDAVLDPKWTSEMVRCLNSDPRAGAAAGLVVDGNRPEVLDSFGVGVSLDGMSRQLECGSPSGSTRRTMEVLAFSGCSCLLRREAIESCGQFDDAFFAYCEDTDLSLRLLRSGWRILACPSARSIHYYSHTGGRFSLQKLYLIERNHQWVALKNFPLPLLMIYPLATLWRLVVQIAASFTSRTPVAGFVSNGILPVAATILKADLAAFVRIPAIFWKRVRYRKQSRHPGSWEFTRKLLANRMPIAKVLFSGALPADDQPH